MLFPRLQRSSHLRLQSSWTSNLVRCFLLDLICFP